MIYSEKSSGVVDVVLNVEVLNVVVVRIREVVVVVLLAVVVVVLLVVVVVILGVVEVVEVEVMDTEMLSTTSGGCSITSVLRSRVSFSKAWISFPALPKDVSLITLTSIALFLFPCVVLVSGRSCVVITSFYAVVK